MREMLWPLAGELPELAEPLDVVVGIEPLSALETGRERPPRSAAPRPGGRGETGRCDWPPAGRDVAAYRSCCLDSRDDHTALSK